MSNIDPERPDADAGQPERTDLRLTYAGASQVIASEGAAQVALYGNLLRDPVHLDGVLKDPLRFREAMAALYAVVASDFRYKPKDRSAYVAYLRMKRESAGLNVWQAQQAYFSWLLRNDPTAFVLLDPIISVHPDQVSFEVFSKDEGTYARLGLNHAALELTDAPACGTTNIDFSPALFEGLQQMRSHRQTRLTIGRDVVKVATAARGEVLEKRITVPDSWLRGFLQVQSATTLPLDSFTLAPIDLYNLLRYLRMHGDRKGQRRGLRIELMPGQKPRLVLEPWEIVLPSSGDSYRGKVARVVRVWGRRRLMLVRRLLAFAERIDVYLLGSGLPSFWIFRAADLSFTLGMTGFTAANWSQAVSFDLLLPRKTQTAGPLETLLTFLRGKWRARRQELSEGTGIQGANLVEVLQVGCQQGRLMYDLAGDVYRLRTLTDKPLDLARLEYRNQRERVAHDLLVRRGAVSIVSENAIPTIGVELTGKVEVQEDKREYRPQMLLSEEGQVNRAECTCSFFRKEGLKAGPCAHLVALRLAYAEQQAQKVTSAEPLAVTTETRTYSKRDQTGEEVVQVSLERQRLKVRWGRAGKEPRVQVLRFNSVEEARAAYFARIEKLYAGGYLEATA
jgi:hypothetical protein